MGYPHHVQTPMGGSTMDPKFPPSEDYHVHSGYGLSTGIPTPQNTSNDYMHHHHHHQTNGLHQNSNNFNYAQSIGGHFYHHHHHGYNATAAAAQMHTPQTNGYSSTGYYGSYYGSTAGHQIMDLPLQCSAAEPTNTALGLQELGVFCKDISIFIFILNFIAYV